MKNPGVSNTASSVRNEIDRKLPWSTLFTMIIKALVHPAEEGGYWAEVPSLPGCVTQGESMEVLRENLQEAIELYLEATNPA